MKLNRGKIASRFGRRSIITGEKTSRAPGQKALAKNLFWWKQAETAETVLADEPTCAPIVNIDKHIFVGMAGKEARKYFDEVFLGLFIGVQEPITDIKPVRPFAAIESGPEARAIDSSLIQHAAELADPGFDLFEVDGLSVGEGGKQKCGCQEQSTQCLSWHPHG
ncbi:MAG TPA: hypothetical protein VF208_10225 [Candidatus Binatia bacterium]